MLFHHRGDLEEAITAYREAIDVNPKHNPSWSNLGAAYIDQGKYDLAIETLSTALERTPDKLDRYDRFCWVGAFFLGGGGFFF